MASKTIASLLFMREYVGLLLIEGDRRRRGAAFAVLNVGCNVISGVSRNGLLGFCRLPQIG
jgi:hypothetical protein